MKNIERAIAAVERSGILLVFPIENRADPPSLWSKLHPKSTMRWEWDASGDSKVADLWHLRAELARSKRVVYMKWFRNRATLLSLGVFRAMLGDLLAEGDPRAVLGRGAHALLELLEDDSPQSTKALRRASGLTDSQFQSEMKTLWSRHAIVGVGEVDDGSFPSLEVGATRLIFEREWSAALGGIAANDRAALEAALSGSRAFARGFERFRRQTAAVESFRIRSTGRSKQRDGDGAAPVIECVAVAESASRHEQVSLLGASDPSDLRQG